MGIDPLHAGLIDIARWSEETYLAPYLDGHAFNGPDALAHLAQTSPEAAKSHDRRITALNQYYGAAASRNLIPAPPNLTDLRSGLDRADGEPKKLDPRERAVLLSCIGMWGPQQARHYRRDRLIVHLLLEHMRPGEVVRLDSRHLYEQPDGSYEVRAPDYDFEALGKQFVLDPLTGAALEDYLPTRPKPAVGAHQLILGQGGRPIVSRYPNMLVRQIADLHPLLAQLQPPVTADVIAHTGLWETPESGVPTSDNSDRPLDAAFVDMANNVCGVLESGVDPRPGGIPPGVTWLEDMVSLLVLLRSRAETAWCRIEIDQTDDGVTLINGVIAPHRIDDLSTLFARLGWQHSVELSDENDNVVEERRH